MYKRFTYCIIYNFITAITIILVIEKSCVIIGYWYLRKMVSVRKCGNNITIYIDSCIYYYVNLLGL